MAEPPGRVEVVGTPDAAESIAVRISSPALLFLITRYGFMADYISCRDRVRNYYVVRMRAIVRLWRLYNTDPGARSAEFGHWLEFGLGFDYIPRFMYRHQYTPYWRFQLSCGGPADEFRFFCDDDLNLTRVEYWLYDWFDKAEVIVRKPTDKGVWREIWQEWLSYDVPQSARREMES